MRLPAGNVWNIRSICGIIAVMEKKAIIEIEPRGSVSVMSFASASIGGIDEIEQISTEIRGYIEKNQPKRVVVDFNGVKFFSSQMLGLLVDIWRRLREYDGKVFISGINPQLSRVFKITNLDRIFEFYPDMESAVAAAEVK
jgi:anti-sigma B factor antagonist